MENEAIQTQGRFKALKRFKRPGKQMFWLWIGYQAVKGTLTTSLIWIPLLYAYFHHT